MDETDAEQEARRQRLREWVRDHGGHARVAADRRLTPSQASYLSQVCNGYSFAARGARGMERRLGIPARWLDTPQSHATIQRPSSTPAPELPAALPVVLTELQGLSPSRWAAVRAVLDQLVMRPDLADDAAAELLHLLTARPDKRSGAR